MEVSEHHHALIALLPGKEPQYPFNRMLGGSQSQYGFEEMENLLPLPGLKCWIIQPIA
jgi:hypothetical protein